MEATALPVDDGLEVLAVDIAAGSVADGELLEMLLSAPGRDTSVLVIDELLALPDLVGLLNDVAPYSELSEVVDTEELLSANGELAEADIVEVEPVVSDRSKVELERKVSTEG